MGCVSSKILTKSGSLQEKVSRRFQSSNLIEEIILSNSKSNGDQFLALISASNSAAGRAKDAEHIPAAGAKIETINVSELLAGLEEENATEEEQERQDREKEKDGDKPSAQCAAGRAKSFRMVEEFDALVTRSSSPEQARPARDASVPPPTQSSSPEQEEPTTVAPGDVQDAMVAAWSSSPEQGEAGGAKRRMRARQLGELSVPPAAFDFSKSGSLRDWLLGGGQTFSPGSYVTPRFGTVAPAPPSEHGGRFSGERQQQHAVFDPELVAQFEQAMEQLSVDEERVLNEILEALELEAGEKGEAERINDRQPVAVQD